MPTSFTAIGIFPVIVPTASKYEVFRIFLFITWVAVRFFVPEEILVVLEQFGVAVCIRFL